MNELEAQEIAEAAVAAEARAQRKAIADAVDEAVERFGRLIVVELQKIRAEPTLAELARGVDNAVRRYKFEQLEPQDVEGLEQEGPRDV